MLRTSFKHHRRQDMWQRCKEEGNLVVYFINDNEVINQIVYLNPSETGEWKKKNNVFIVK